MSLDDDNEWWEFLDAYEPAIDADDIYGLEEERYEKELDKFFQKYYEDEDYSDEDVSELYANAERMIREKIMQHVLDIAKEELK